MTDVITRDELRKLPTKRKKSSYPEHKIQRAIIDHVKVFKKPDLTWYHIPNGSSIPRGKMTLIRLAQIGMWAGVPDLYFARPCYGFPGAIHAYYLEVKAPDGRVKPDQREAQKWLEKQGNNVSTCYSAEEGIDQLQIWGLLRVCDKDIRDQLKIVARIRALLAKTIDHGATDAEATASALKAQELIEKHNINPEFLR